MRNILHPQTISYRKKVNCIAIKVNEIGRLEESFTRKKGLKNLFMYIIPVLKRQYLKAHLSSNGMRMTVTLEGSKFE